MVLKDDIAKDKRFFKTGSGKLINYSFIPAIVNKLYSDWIDMIQSALKLQEEISSSKDIKDIQALIEKAVLVSKESIELRDKIIMYIINNNKQKFDITIDTIYEVMSAEDFNNLIMSSVGVDLDVEAKKK